VKSIVHRNAGVVSHASADFHCRERQPTEKGTLTFEFFHAGHVPFDRSNAASRGQTVFYTGTLISTIINHAGGGSPKKN